MRFTVRAPASAANLGPGFDTLGLALDLWNEIVVDTNGEPGAVALEGRDAALLGGRENLAVTAMRELATAHGRPLPPFALLSRTRVPVARGLGSSAAALAAGLVAADHLLALGLTTAELFGHAWRMEGHGDNVGAALYGGAVLAVPTIPDAVCLASRASLGLVGTLFVPEVTGATWAARAALPATVPHPDAVHNVAAVSGLVVGLRTSDHALIAAGMHDRLHEPYRARLFPHLTAMVDAARDVGAIGACLSGAGPSILALVAPDRAAAVAAAYAATARHLGVPGETATFEIAERGAYVIADSEAARDARESMVVGLTSGTASR
jgi:homoserine kinase